MGTPSDVELMKTIYRAERDADRIVRDAEEAAKVLLAEAEAAAKACLEETSIEYARLGTEKRDKAAAEAEKEALALLEHTRLQAEAWVRRSEPGIDAIADALLERILPE